MVFRIRTGEALYALSDQDMQDTDKLRVFYDGACPLCRREIGFYRRRRGADNVEWCDLSEMTRTAVAPGLDRDAALARFHVQKPDGSLASGGDAFRALWLALPVFRPVARVLGLPGLRRLLNVAYDRFLVLRPRLQRLASK